MVKSNQQEGVRKSKDSAHKPNSIVVNGINVSVENYLKNPQKFHHHPIRQKYLETVCQELSNQTVKEFDLDLTEILTLNKKRIKK